MSSVVGNRSCDDERRAWLVLLLFRVKNELDHAAVVVEECARGYDQTCSDEYLVAALAAVEDLAESLSAALSQLKERAGEDVAKRAGEMLMRLKEYRRRLGCA